MYECILNQLQDNCNCIGELDGYKIEQNIEQLLLIVSTLTCWRDETCGTFLSSDRYERFTINYERDCNCNHKIMDVPLRYPMVKEETIQATLVYVDGVKRTRTIIDAEDVFYDAYEGILYMDLYKYISECDCSCDAPMYIEVTYVAGYDCLPSCLLPVFCDYLQYIIEMNKCSCENCDSCGDENEITVEESNAMQESVGFLTRQHIIEAYNKELGYISLCRETHLKGVVI